MDVRVINVEEESDHQATDDGDAERSDGEINNAESFGFNVEEGSSSETRNLHPRKHFSSVGRTMPESYQGVGLVPSGVMYGSTDGNHVSNQNTCAVLNIHASTAADPSLPVKNATSMNFTARPPSQNRTLGKDAHHLLEWTKNAKSSAGSDELHGQEFLTSRYSNLCREAIRYAEEGAVTVETYNVAVTGLKEGGKKVTAMKRNVAKAKPPNSQASGTNNNKKTTTSSTSDLTPLLWPRQDEITGRFNLNDSGGPVQSGADPNLPRMTPVSLHRDGGPSGNAVLLPCLKAMTWVMENKNSSLGKKVAVINLKLQDNSRNPSTEVEVKFQLSRVTLEPMLTSMASISEQLSRPANKVAVINLNLQDMDTNYGESEVKFQVSKDTLGAMLRSMAYIREQLSHVGDAHSEPLSKKHKK
ncbi:hypothetical protein P8452_26580 [Trifolium repens]|nr:hypothetical protein P8452_26580 [Trifolium repens]